MKLLKSFLLSAITMALMVLFFLGFVKASGIIIIPIVFLSILFLVGSWIIWYDPLSRQSREKKKGE